MVSVVTGAGSNFSCLSFLCRLPLVLLLEGAESGSAVVFIISLTFPPPAMMLLTKFRTGGLEIEYNKSTLALSAR